MSGIQVFAPGQTALVTATSSSQTIAIPAGFVGRGHSLQIQVGGDGNAAFAFGASTVTAAAPSGTPSATANEIFSGNTVTWVIGQTPTTIAYIRVGSANATVLLTWGDGL